MRIRYFVDSPIPLALKKAGITEKVFLSALCLVPFVGVYTWIVRTRATLQVTDTLNALQQGANKGAYRDLIASAVLFDVYLVVTLFVLAVLAMAVLTTMWAPDATARKVKVSVESQGDGRVKAHTSAAAPQSAPTQDNNRVI